MKPKFFNANCEQDFICKGSTKPCFVLSRYEKLNEFMSDLSNKIQSPIELSSYLGYKVLYVQEGKYEEAIIEGLKLITNNNSYKKAGITWINHYSEKAPWGYVQILEFNVTANKLASNGGWKKSTKHQIKRWNKQLQKTLNVKVEVDEYLGKARFFIPRTVNSHLEHEKILNKVRNSQILEKTPFSEYALLDYFGKFIE